MVLIAVIVLATWVTLSVLVARAVHGGRAAPTGRSTCMVAPAAPQAPVACDFVAGFAEPEPETAPAARPASRTRT